MPLRLKCILSLLLCLCLGACSSHLPRPQETLAALTITLPATLHIQQTDDEQSLDWLMVIQEETNGLRLSLFDPLGTPQARQQLNDQGWHNDGLLPPNPEAKQLFSALLFALTPVTRLNQQYPQTSWRINADESRTLEPDWQVTYAADIIILDRLRLSRHYIVSPLSQERQP